MKFKLDYVSEILIIAEEHLIVHFRSGVDCGEAIEGPWFVARQLLVMEVREPDFVPGRKVITKIMVWLCLPVLPMEFWMPSMILAITAEIDEPLAIDYFIDLLQKTKYARIRVEINSVKPLKPWILVRGKKGIFRQTFVYENLPIMCHQCGHLGHTNGGCHFPKSELSSDISDGSLQPGNLIAKDYGGRCSSPSAPMIVDGKVDSVVGDTNGGRLRLDPWLVTSRFGNRGRLGLRQSRGRRWYPTQSRPSETLPPPILSY